MGLTTAPAMPHNGDMSNHLVRTVVGRYNFQEPASRAAALATAETGDTHYAEYEQATGTFLVFRVHTTEEN